MQIKKHTLLACMLLLLATPVLQAQKKVYRSAGIVRLSDSTIRVQRGAIVPKSYHFFVETAQGKPVAAFKAGQRVKPDQSTVRSDMDCVEISCPPGFRPDVHCWRCRPRPPEIQPPHRDGQ